jgi:hypothetical protein
MEIGLWKKVETTVFGLKKLRGACGWFTVGCEDEKLNVCRNIFFVNIFYISLQRLLTAIKTEKYGYKNPIFRA